jgi:hypothetical protein
LGEQKKDTLREVLTSRCSRGSTNKYSERSFLPKCKKPSNLSAALDFVTL